MNKKKITMMLLLTALTTAGAYAQGNGMAGIKVYNKFSSGDPDTSKTAASWFGACIFLIVAATILRSFFL